MKNKNIATEMTLTNNRLLMLAVFGVATLLMFSLAYKASAATISSQLDVGSRGADVLTVQSYLATTPYYPEGLVTGYYGSLTAAAVRRYQAANGLEQVGRVGPLTMQRLNSVMGGVTSAGTAPIISNVSLQQNSNNNGSTTRDIMVNWNTNSNTIGRIYFATNPLQIQEGQSATAAPIVSNGSVSNAETNYGTYHSVTLTGLNTNTPYYYFVESADQAGNVSMTWPTTFTTNQ